MVLILVSCEDSFELLVDVVMLRLIVWCEFELSGLGWFYVICCSVSCSGLV